MLPPQNLVAYKVTPDFTTHTVPRALTRAHSTKAGVWGRIEVLEGRLVLRRLGGTSGPIDEEIAAGASGLCAPEEPHFVTLDPGTVFRVAFLKPSS